MKEESKNALNILHELKERQKELRCLYEISALLKSIEEPVEDLLHQVLDVIPEGYQFPDICRAKISLGDIVVQHEDFIETELKQSTNITADGEIAGEIQVAYIKKIKSETEGIFLNEEKKLIDAISNEIGQYLTITRYRNLINKNNDLSESERIDQSVKNWLMKWELNESQISKILFSEVAFNKDEIILKQGTKASYVVLLTDGLVKVLVGDLSGRNFSFKICKPFEFIGLNSILGSLKWDYSALTIVKSKGYIIDFEQLEACFTNNEAFKSKVTKELGRSNELLYHKINMLANRQALGRLTNTLLYLWSDVFDKHIIENSITRRTIAELSGMSTENCVRILSELKKDNLITITKKGINIIDSNVLETYSNVG